jgi:hypothetical protein
VGWQETAEQLPRPLGASDHPRFSRVSQYGCVAFGFALNGTYAMQRVTAAKEEQIAGLKDHAANQFTAVAFENPPHRGKIFIVGRADVWAIFENATALGLLRQKTDREFVRIEMPGMLAAGLEHVETQSGQRIGKLENTFHPKTRRDEALECPALKELIYEEALRNLIACNEPIAAFQPDLPGVLLWEILIDWYIVYVDRLGMHVSEKGDGSTLGGKAFEPEGPYETWKDRTSGLS